MASVTFDTLKFSERLKSAGVPEAQAKAMAEAQRDVLAEALDSTLATKSDVSGLQQSISDVKSELKQEMAEFRSELKLIKWMLGLLLGGVIALILKAFFPS